jgi:hypothetical protein
MNTRHLIAASLAGGLVSAVLVNTPFVSLINLLVCAGFWIGPIAAVWIYARLAGKPSMRQAIGIGVLAGAWHGILGLGLSALGLAGAGSMLNELRGFVSPGDLPDVETALTGIGGVLFNLVGVVIDMVFGLVGGLLGGAIFGARRTAV